MLQSVCNIIVKESKTTAKNTKSVGERDLEQVLEFEAKRSKKEEVHGAVLQSEASECIENFCMSFLE